MRDRNLTRVSNAPGSFRGYANARPPGSNNISNAPPPGLRREQMPGLCPGGGMGTAGIDWCITLCCGWTDVRTYGCTDVRTDGHVTITSLPKFLGLIGYQISLAMELRWCASPLAPLLIKCHALVTHFAHKIVFFFYQCDTLAHRSLVSILTFFIPHRFRQILKIQHLDSLCHITRLSFRTERNETTRSKTKYGNIWKIFFKMMDWYVSLFLSFLSLKFRETFFRFAEKI